VTSSAAGDGRTLPYWSVLRNGRLATLLVGDFAAFTGNGMVIVALPLQTLRIHGAVPAAFAIALVETSNYFVGTVLAFALGLGRVRVPPRALILADCGTRAVFLAGLGTLALLDRLSLWELVVGLLVGSTFRLVGSSGRRLIATGMVPPEGVFAVNGLLGTGNNLALYVAGPVLGGIVAVAAGPGTALIVDAACSVALFAAVVFAVPAQPPIPTGEAVPASGWWILRRFPAVTRLFAVVFLFNLFYMPVEVALPLLVAGPLHAGGRALGAIWGAFGAGALLGALGTNQLRLVRQRPLLIAVIGGWGASVVLLAFAPAVPVAALAFAIGGLIYAPFTPIVYSMVQSVLRPDEQQPVVTLWAAGATVSAPIGLALGGPLVDLVGPRGGLVLSAALTIALAPWAARRQPATSGSARPNATARRPRGTRSR
jgi:predicted MFS family arabinose efflux permease